MKLTEDDWQRQVIDLLEWLGWHRWVHFRPARTAHGWRTPFSGAAGFPDIVAVFPTARGVAGRIAFLELKVKPNKPDQMQLAWIADLAGVPGVIAGVFYPEQVDDLVELLRYTPPDG